MILLVIPLLGGVISSMIATGKGRNGLGWFVIGLLLPLIGVILILVLPPGGAGLLGIDSALYVDLQPGISPHMVPSPTRLKVEQDAMTALQELAARHDRGELTTQEFEEQQRALLADM